MSGDDTLEALEMALTPEEQAQFASLQERLLHDDPALLRRTRMISRVGGWAAAVPLLVVAGVLLLPLSIEVGVPAVGLGGYVLAVTAVVVLGRRYGPTFTMPTRTSPPATGAAGDPSAGLWLMAGLTVVLLTFGDIRIVLLVAALLTLRAVLTRAETRP